MKLIVVEDGARTALEFNKPEITLGRAIDNDIRLAGAHASRHHCKIEQGKETWLFDLGSANGVQVNGVKVDKKALREGDVLTIGGARLYVEKLGVGTDPSGTQRIDATGSEGQSPVPSAPPVPAVLPDFGAGGFETGADERRDLERLRTFARVTKALTSETELVPLLRLIVDSALALVGGERGFVLLTGKLAGGEDVKDPREMRVRVARSFDRTDIAVPSTRISQGITHRVLESGRPLLSVDAGRDEPPEGAAAPIAEAGGSPASRT